MQTPIISATTTPYLEQVAAEFQLPLLTESDAPYQLHWSQEKDTLALVQTDLPKQTGVKVDFLDAAVNYRRANISVKNELIARACGLKGQQRPSIIDATAGLGRDAFILAALGCKVTLIERTPAVAALLFDGLRRARLHPDLSDWISQRMQLIYANALQLSEIKQKRQLKADVVYLDPMFPHKKKSAAVKKEMKSFQGLVGADADADLLLPQAKSCASKRVVVKRPGYANFINDETPDFSVKSKKHRFDVYLTMTEQEN
ncbi:class I SAM-dependent methyltransferase [Gayadomonas joobiniege]|uniref:class I SAM-dependent methyltransferase n=1 Tax=Gayadomonas joobiniege TaxID=1234606 RepID=UPI00037A870C|nr:class I SAM-dependent methyltransferase [Gayadomonas joobiniege]